jgi:AraC-like DNA-binding protein/mannose-6-phosphate isomerase-like protein (cupin superfamily)
MLSPDRRDQEDRLHDERLAWVETTEGAVLALPTDFPDGHKVPAHRHSRSQLLYALSGVVLVTTDEGRWMVPPEHAIWLPAGTRHAVEMLGEVAMRSIYVRPDALASLPAELKVVAMTALMRSLIVEAVRLAPNPDPSTRAGLLMGLLLHEIPALPPRPLGLPFPADARLVELCRRFLAQPAPRAGIDGWARAAGMSRRSFTRLFHRQTGIGLSTWRQQACLFAALPRLADGEPITRVALDLGYESVPAFTTMFKRMLGEPPRSYLRKVE